MSNKEEEVVVETNKTKVDFTKGGVEKFKFYPDNPLDPIHKRNFAAKEPSKFYDPCAESSKMSIRCIEQNYDNKQVCSEYFQAYRECKKEWLKQRRLDRINGDAW